MKKLTRDGTVVWAEGESAAALIYAGWVEVNAPPTKSTPMTHAERRAYWQTREAVKAAEAQLWLTREAERVADEAERADRQWVWDCEQRVAQMDLALAAREEAWADQAALQQLGDATALSSLKDQLIDAMALQDKHPHPANAAEVTRLRAEIKALYVSTQA